MKLWSAWSRRPRVAVAGRRGRRTRVVKSRENLALWSWIGGTARAGHGSAATPISQLENAPIEFRLFRSSRLFPCSRSRRNAIRVHRGPSRSTRGRFGLPEERRVVPRAHEVAVISSFLPACASAAWNAALRLA